ncbi:chloroplast light harvesting protein [Pavlovales sp. CCMP2436]|nr:chloroplast light harvesting protein [Pavlovales sp. CCMP2436]|mmetsp:Transcript_1011/g.2627  ORF Transcript_1011/g.2627 Transcript_1011/m.2627 type:complete len:203 (+) Transcript_1011:60-668(+)
MLATAIVSALAFNGPATRTPVRSGSVQMMAKSQALPFLEVAPALDGSMAGDVGFDPLGFAKSDAQTLTWLREAEIKHGRVCMLATAGWIAVDQGVHFPGAAYEGLKSLTAHNAMVDSGNMYVMLMAVFMLEAVGGLALYEQSLGSGRAAGDYGFDPMGMAKDDTTLKVMQLKEIKNGRLAMVAFSGIVTQAALTGHDFPYTF